MSEPNKKKKNNASGEKALSREADEFLASACAEYDGKQQALEHGEWRLSDCADWEFEDTTGIVTVRFSNGGEWQATGQFLGQFQTKDQTFQWAWDMPNLPQQMTRDAVFLKKLGEKLGLRYLVLGDGPFPLPGLEFLDYLCAIALKGTNSIGVMEAEAGADIILLTLKNPRWTRPL